MKQQNILNMIIPTNSGHSTHYECQVFFQWCLCDVIKVLSRGNSLLSIFPVSSDSRDSPILLIGRSPRDEINQAIEIIVTNFSSSLQSPIITSTKSFSRLMINAIDEVLYSLFKGRASIVFCSRGSEMLTEITILSVPPNDWLALGKRRHSLLFYLLAFDLRLVIL